MAGLVAVSPQPASAATGNILPPFDIGQTWNICRGYDYASHTGTSEYGLDLTGAGCDNSAAGRNVRAPISGTVAYWQASYGNLCINIAGGGSYTLTHINTSVTSGSVTAGQVVGTVAPAAPVGVPPNNNGLAHLHFQIWRAPGCYNNSVVPFDSADGTRICGAPDLTANGPNGGNGTWSGTSFTGAACGNPASWGGVGTATFLGTGTLGPGQEMDSNQYMLSADARFALVLQTDGNLVLYNGSALWQSRTGGSGATHAVMQMDGNLVLYTASNTPVWQSNTSGGPAHLVVQTDGNVVTYNNSSGSPTWWTGTGGHTATHPYRSDTLTATPHELDASTQDYLLSSNGQYALLMQSDGNLVLYGPGYHVLWFKNLGATKLVMQTDGNLVLYNGGTALWQTATNGTSTNRVVMQTDGNLVTYTASNSPTWWTGTSGP